MGRRIRYSRCRTSPPSTLLDFLAARFPYLTPAAWAAHIAAGHLTVRGIAAVEPAHILQQGDEIEFNPPRELEPVVDEYIKIPHRDAAVIVCVKNGNLPVAEGGRYSGNTLVGVLQRRDAADVGRESTREGKRKRSDDGNDERIDHTEASMCFPVHRLDKETSGLVVLAKNANAARLLSMQFEQQSETLTTKVSQLTDIDDDDDDDDKEMSLNTFEELLTGDKVVIKSYIAVLEGAPAVGAVFIVCDRIGLLSESIPASSSEAQYHTKLKKLKMTCFPASVKKNPERHGRSACSRIRILSSDKTLGVSVASVDILTGRTHQIRLHCAQIGFPVLGDKLYETSTPGVVGGCRAVPDDIYLERARECVSMVSTIAPQLRVKRHLLHAAVLAFSHPITKERLMFFSDPREWFLRDVSEESTADKEGNSAIEALRDLLEKAMESPFLREAQLSNSP
ncbi:putative RNA pseudouridylate synthase [Trypanosoma theileri]|uniref:Putative RNA pseudouridylate synthase n=1 Tax=Trypanosoma theileri TaxID=67003 RepID=A0A1X0P1W3_9TRYP|nr:putative RNA pseudouridylate synthase [Trypanosoma theileri]ORC90885.1 putative RNA pseudouridylate synthase [Trypanosoma theileri]